MAQKQYYYLISSLIQLIIDSGKKPLSLAEFMDFCSEEMAANDYDSLKKIFLFNDIKNAIYYNSENYKYLTPSYYTEEEFYETLKDTDSFLPFLADYFHNKKHEKREYPDLMEIDEIVLLFYLNLDNFAEGFVKDYFLFELNLQNVTTALSLKMNNLPISNKIIPFEYLSEQILKSNSPDFGIAQDLDYLEKLTDVYKNGDLIKIEKTIEEIRWDWLSEQEEGNAFSPLAVFCYAVRLSSVERWASMNDEKGKEVLDNLINNIKESVKI